jgi:ATP-dependent DNA helicase RecQ
LDTRARADELLRIIAGQSATFHPNQFEAIAALVDDRRKALVVQRTGWGKSAVYLIATKLLRERGAGPTVIVSPLLALMRNQIEMTHGLGIEAVTINSTNTDRWEETFAQIEAGSVDLLLISPERLNNAQFVRDVMPVLMQRIGLLVVDEVHCISDWGHDFRPDYRRLSNVVGLLPAGVPVLGTTATANSRVVADVESQLGGDLFSIRGTLDRESLELHVIEMPDRAERMAWLVAAIPRLPGSGIVYCLTVRDVERIAAWLRAHHIDAEAYSGKVDTDHRLDIEERLGSGELKVVVATSALGMGYDNPHIEFVVHYQSPGSPIAYYQQVGRAGRAVSHAYGVLLAGAEDADIQDCFIRTAFPEQIAAEAVIEALGVGGGLRLADLDAIANVPAMRLKGMLKILEVEGAVYREDGRWYRSAQRWKYPTDRVAEVTAQRRAEQAAMLGYQQSSSCLLEQLRLELDDPSAAPCGRCGNCRGQGLRFEIDPAAVVAATEFLNRTDVAIRPRLRWPLGYEAASLRNVGLAQGRALAVWGDPGLAQLVRDGKQQTHRFDDRLVSAVADLVERWSPDPAPDWLTWVPAFQGGGIVADFAARLGRRLGLPVRDFVTKVAENHPQKTMQNSFHQARNVQRAFAVIHEVSGHGLLVDDTVDSRWTLTVIGSLLRDAGAETVYPVALADASRGGQ